MPEPTPTASLPPTDPDAESSALAADIKEPEQQAKEAKIEQLKNESTLHYICRGPDYFASSMFLLAIVSFAFTLWIVRKPTGSNRTMALALIVPLPLLMGCYGFCNYLMQTMRVIDESGTSPDPTALAGAFAGAIDAVLNGFLYSLPAFLLTLGFAIVRASNEKVEPPISR